MRFDDALPLLAALLPLSSAAPGLSDTDQTTTPASLVARTDVSNDGTLHCGNFATGSKITSRGLLTDIDAGANGKIAAATFLVKAGACQRVHCWDTTGVYVCNDASKTLILTGNDVWLAANPIYKNCCWGTYGADNESGVSGQKFIRGTTAAGATHDYNVVLGYANCRHGKDVRPSAEGGGGVNRACAGGVLNPASSW